MGKITKKLIRYFTTAMALVILLCVLLCALFISKYYMEKQYSNLKSRAEATYAAILEGDTSGLSQALIIKNGVISYFGRKMGSMAFIKNTDIDHLKERGEFKNPKGEVFLYYNMTTDLGNIVVFEDKKSTGDILNIINLILLLVFILGLLICIPIFIFLGKKLTSPALKLKDAALSISQGNYDVVLDCITGDELEEASRSINIMAKSLKEKDALQKSFIANVSHDFKTPISVIRGYGEVIRDGLAEENIVTYGNNIVSEADRLNHMVMELLQLSKLREGSIKLNFATFSLSDTFTRSVEAFMLKAKERGIILELHCDNCNIIGDEDYISRVIYNLLENALKFTPEGGTIKASLEVKSQSATLSICNEGSVIEADLLPHIWERYYKGSTSGGIGLGLAICKEILVQHGFLYGVQSDEATGTCFYFTAACAAI